MQNLAVDLIHQNQKLCTKFDKINLYEKDPFFRFGTLYSCLFLFHQSSTAIYLRHSFFLTGLSNVIRKIVLEQLGHFMVLPNKFTMALSEEVSQKQLKCPDSAGVLRVNLIRADQLLKKDIGVLGLGKSDPYAILRVGAKEVKTKVINNTITPEWFFYADFPIEVVKGQYLTLEVFDHDDPGDDEFLGRCTIATSVVAERGHIEKMWTELEDVKSGKIQWSLHWLETTTDKSALQGETYFC